MKKGQITIFIVLGIVIIAIIALGVFFSSNLSKNVRESLFSKSQASTFEGRRLESYSSSCLDKVTIEGLERIFIQGGYYKGVPSAVRSGGYDIPLYNRNIISRDELMINLARYIEDNLETCIQSYKEGVTTTRPKVKIYADNKLEVKVKESISYKDNDTEIKIEGFSTRINFDFGSVYDSINKFYCSVKNISSLDLIDIGLMALKDKYDFDQTVTNNIAIFVLNYPKIIDDRKDLKFQFGVSFSKNKLNYNFTEGINETKVNQTEKDLSLDFVTNNFETEEV